MSGYDPRVQYVIAHFAEAHGVLVSISGSRPMEPGWYCIEQGGEPVTNDGKKGPPAARYFGPFDTPDAALKDAVWRLT